VAGNHPGLLKSAGIKAALRINTVVVLLGAIGLWLATGTLTTFCPAGTSWTPYLGGIFGDTPRGPNAR